MFRNVWFIPVWMPTSRRSDDNTTTFVMAISTHTAPAKTGMGARIISRIDRLNTTSNAPPIATEKNPTIIADFGP